MKIKLAAAAINTTPIDWEGNSRSILAAVEEAARQKVALLCLPELCITGYGCEDLFFRPHIRAQALATLSSLAEASTRIDHCPTFAVGLPIEFEGALYNAVAVIARGTIRGFYAKQNLAGDGVHYEPRQFKPWPKGVVRTGPYSLPLGDIAFDLEGPNGRVTFGFEICEDAWVAERPGIGLAKAAVDIILNPSASHFAFGKTKVRERFVIDSSRAFSCAYVYANLLGNEAGRIIYDGECLIANGGELIVKGERFGYAPWNLTSAVVDLSGNRVARLRSASFQSVPRDFFLGGDLIEATEPATPPQPSPGIAPWCDYTELRATTPEVREKLIEFLGAMTLGLFDYVRKAHADGFVISKSGGADSTLCALLVHEMVNAGFYGDLHRPKGDMRTWQAFIAAFPWVAHDPNATALSCTRRLLTLIYQGTSNSSAHTLAAAEAVGRDIGARFIHADVQPLVEFAEKQLESYLGRPLTWETDDLTRQNIQARARAMLPWTIANAENKLNITTSNRSEAAVGYCTMDGDTAGSIGPLGGIDKATILAFLDALLPCYPSIAHVRAKPPTAELKPQEANQTDEKDLMPYAVLDRIERASLLQGKSPEEIVADGLATPEQTKRFFRLFARNQWKRERYAPSFHLDAENLDPRSFCRWPILNGGFNKETSYL